jgi:hypothetical protein
MHMNDKFIVRLEAGPMEQLYKFDQVRYPGLEYIEKLADAPFLEEAVAHFNTMYGTYKAAMERTPGKSD